MILLNKTRRPKNRKLSFFATGFIFCSTPKSNGNIPLDFRQGSYGEANFWAGLQINVVLAPLYRECPDNHKHAREITTAEDGVSAMSRNTCHICSRENQH